MKYSIKGAFMFISVILLVLNHCSIHAQSNNWQNNNYQESGECGMSVDKAYKKLLVNKKSHPVIIAVIDGGTDPIHPDFKSKIWVNQGETPANGIDDDQNGYIDDINGWNFLGRVQYGNLEITRVVREYRKKYKGLTEDQISSKDKKDYDRYMELNDLVEFNYLYANTRFLKSSHLQSAINKIETIYPNDSITIDELNGIDDTDELFTNSLNILKSQMEQGKSWESIKSSVKKKFDYFSTKTKYHYNIDSDPRDELRDDPNDYNRKGYGNYDVKGPEARHGTHVAGIIGAVRDNKEGINGIAGNIELMILRAVPDGDEHDKDVSLAIRYAVDNGAKIINMSFGKDYSPGKKYVDEAVKYAEIKDVLIVHGSGNDGKNTDKDHRYPNRYYSDSKSTSSNWIEVGASTSTGDAAYFSNYGKKGVDVFAPGVKINSTVPDGEYAKLNGTSMAAPGVTGVAGLIRSYYPQLTASEVRKIIIESAVTYKKKTKQPGTKKPVKFKSLCKSGGIADAFNALKMAEEMHK
jgi:cell wall-associated protease